MSKQHFWKNKNAMYAIYIGIVCSASYLAVYFARNVLGAVTPQMLQAGFNEKFIGQASSLYFICYGIGQLINGSIGDRIKARYMISVGLVVAGVFNIMFSALCEGYPFAAMLAYGLSGFFLSMIYGPMTKTVAENTEPIYASRCGIGYMFASFIGTPLAGVAASAFEWRPVFLVSTLSLFAMGAICFCLFLVLEKKKIIRYNQYQRQKETGGNIKLLFKRQLVRFTLISIITGVIRTTVVFWMPTYLSQHLGYSPERSSQIFTVSTFCISLTAFIAIIIVYEKLMKRNMNRSILFSFGSAAIFFCLLYFVKNPILNIVCLVLAIISSNCASSITYNIYCPSLFDTGMVSSATGFIDFSSYLAASVSTTLFANAITTIGWNKLIMIWCLLMVAGVLTALPYKSLFTLRQKAEKGE